MGRQLNKASKKISKSENKKQMNSLIYKVLRPKVYITDSSNFKNLVQQLTGNNISNPIPFVQEQMNMDNIQNHFLPCFSNSPQSIPSSCNTSLANSPESMPSYVSETTFNVLDSSFATNDHSTCSSFGDIESWLLEIDSFSCDWNAFDNHIPLALPQLSFHGSDFHNLW